MHKTKPKTITYYYHAECPIDEVRLMLALPREEIVSVESVSEDFGANGYATALTVKTLTLDQVRDYMCQVVDGHRMVQTVNYADQYTGDLYYDAFSHRG